MVIENLILWGNGKKDNAITTFIYSIKSTWIKLTENHTLYFSKIKVCYGRWIGKTYTADTKWVPTEGIRKCGWAWLLVKENNKYHKINMAIINHNLKSMISFLLFPQRKRKVVFNVWLRKETVVIRNKSLKIRNPDFVIHCFKIRTSWWTQMSYLLCTLGWC